MHGKITPQNAPSFVVSQLFFFMGCSTCGDGEVMDRSNEEVKREDTNATNKMEVPGA